MGFKSTDSNVNEEGPYPIKTVEVTDVEMAQLALDYGAAIDKTPYVVCNVQDPNNKSYYQWNGTAWVNLGFTGAGETIIDADIALSGIVGTSRTTFASIPTQVKVPKLTDVGSYTKVEAKLAVSHNSTGANTGEAQLFDYTDGLALPTTNLVLPNATWVYAATGWVDITAQEGKALRVQIKKVGVAGQIQLEGAIILLKYT